MSCDSFFTTITWLGSLYFLLPSCAILALFLVCAGRSREFLLLGLSLSVTVIVTHVTKLIFRRPRPDSLELLIPTPTDWSFPSGHTAQATAFFLTVTIIAIRSLPPVWAVICAIASTLIIISVGWSRVYLQVHYLSDVVAGCALAVILVIAVHKLLPYLHALNRD
ncbi:MAG: phosphatase PAP2 family protein [Desulfocapsaceae bacterium]|nr:phosphatase PAP2 family protein [Desulfocapsaceae bacterium]